MTTLLRTILSEVSRKKYSDTEAGDVQHLIREIFDFLQDKRYLIVVDDLWDSKSWETIQNALIRNNCGSRIITTTRKIEVAEARCSSGWGHIHRLRPLSPENSKELFLKRILFALEEGCPPHLTEVCDNILKKCDGLPLAIIAIAGLLAGKARTVDEWKKVQLSFGDALERHTDVNRILSLSYFDLPLHLRSCLLYLSMFPEDYEVQKDRLILRWIAEGFIHEEHGFTQYELGERCFNELINRSLIQPVHDNGELSCRVHDMVLEFIVSKAVEENFVTLFGVPNIPVDTNRKIRRLSLQGKNNEVSDMLVGSQKEISYCHARAVSVFSSDHLGSLSSLREFKHLRVLDLEGCWTLEAHHLTHLGRLFALRYLSIRNTRIRELPKEIGELQCLQTLDVRRTYVEFLSSVGFPVRLVTLLCDADVRLPDGFEKNMQALQRLDGVGNHSASLAQDLRQLRNLQALKLVIKGVISKDLVSSLCTLGTRCLNSLVILFLDGDIQNRELLMDPWSPIPFGLKMLKLGIKLPRVPRWMGSLDNLQKLTLFVEQLRVADFALLGSLNALSILLLRVHREVVDRSSSSEGSQRVKISGSHGFPTLRMFRVGSDYCALGLLFEAGAMPKLHELTLVFDGGKTGSLTNKEFDFGIQHLPCLAQVRCYLGHLVKEEYPKHPAWVDLKKAVSSHPNHPKLCYTNEFW